jgi:hypothetical protein
MFHLQEAELHIHEEQEEDHRQAGAEEVLQPLPGAHRAQGNQVAGAVALLQASSSNG